MTFRGYATSRRIPVPLRDSASVEQTRFATGQIFSDFEDAVLREAACNVGAAAIVTCNGKDFGRSVLPVCDPAELLAAASVDLA